MKKEDLLKNYKKENVDEGKEHVNNISTDYGFGIMLFFASAIMMYQAYKNLPFGDIASLLFVFLAFTGFRRYKDTKEKGDLSFGIVNLIVSIAFLSWYVVQTI